MKRVTAALPLLWLAGAACGPALAQSRLHEFEGTWIWDANESQLPAMPPGSDFMVGKTMSVARDDGVYYKASYETIYRSGTRLVSRAAFAEDGAFHAAGPDTMPFMERITVLPDGGRHLLSTMGKVKHEAFCHVEQSGRTLTCSGTHIDEDGTSSPFGASITGTIMPGRWLCSPGRGARRRWGGRRWGDGAPRAAYKRLDL